MRRRAGLVVAMVGAGLSAALAAQVPTTPAEAAPKAPAAVAQQPAPSTTAPPSSTVPAPATPSAPGTPAPPPLDRISFEFKVPPAKGGGALAGTADNVETAGESEVTLAGAVEIHYKNMVFKADHAVFHRDTMTVEAEGDVILDQGTRRIAAQRTDLDLATEKGTFWNASAYASPDQYFTAKVLVKTGDDTFELHDGVLTSCTGDRTPDWSIRVSHARVRINGYAHLTNSRIRVKKLPVFYMPYMIWPVKTDRSSGFLIPQIGYSGRHGASLGLAYYQVMGPSADLTVRAEGYQNTYSGVGAELRYAPTVGTKGDMAYYILDNRDTGQQEWRGIWNHTSALPGGLKAVVSYNNYSDYGFFREFQTLEAENTRSFLYSNAFLSGNWGAQSFSMLVDDREGFFPNGVTTSTRQLPKIVYGVRKLKLGSMPLYFSLDSTTSYLQSTSTNGPDLTYGRLDVDPKLTLPLTVAPWLSVAFSAGGSGTWWQKSKPTRRVDPMTGVTETVCGDTVVPNSQIYCDQSLTRVFPNASMDIIGPSFSRIFDSPGGKFSKFKHVIEPRWSYFYVGQFNDQNRVLQFDQVDRIGSGQMGSFALVNRVLAKPTDETKGGAFEIFSFQLAQIYSFDKNQPLQHASDGRTSQVGPILGQIRYSPSQSFDLQAKVSYSTFLSGLNSTSLSFSAHGDRAGVDATWYTNYNAELGTKISDQARFGFKLGVLPNRLDLTGQINYDILNKQVLQQTYGIAYTSQCWSVVFQGREQITNAYRTRDYRLLLNLKNVGTFLDLGGGQSKTRY